MSLVLEPFAESAAPEWDAFIAERARNGSLLHTRRFFAHDPANATDDASLLFRRGGRLVAVMPAALTPGDDGPTFNSHPRATYGGLVVAPEVGSAATIEMIDRAIAHARALGAERFVIRNPFRVFHAMPSDESDYALWLRGFTIQSRELEVAVLTRGMAAGSELASYEPTTRNRVRRALRSGVAVGVSDAYPEFWAMLESNLADRHAARPTHSLARFQTLRALVGDDAVHLIEARHEGRMVAGAVALVVNRRALHAQYIASSDEGRVLCAPNLVIHRLVETCVAGGYDYLSLGRCTENGGRTQNAGLFAFKEGFGGRGVLRETMELDLRTVAP